jgi:hypothetical protein
MLLHKECLPTQLGQPLEQAVIAATFNDCNGDPLAPDTQLAKCSDIPAAQQLSISGNVVSLTNGGSVTLPAGAAPVPQVLSLYNDVLTLSNGGGSVTLTDSDNQTLDLQGNVLSISNGNSVTLPAGATQDPYATPAQTATGTATNLIVNPSDLYARENIPAQTGVSNDVTAIPAPTAGQSPWAVNQLGETLHYAPGLGWQIVDKRFGAQIMQPAGTIPTPVSAWATAVSLTVPRAGRVVVTGHIVVDNSHYSSTAGGIAVNGINKTASNSDSVGPISAPSEFAGGTGAATHQIASVNAALPWTGDVVAGDVIQLQGITVLFPGQMRLGNLEYTYIN